MSKKDEECCKNDGGCCCNEGGCCDENNDCDCCGDDAGHGESNFLDLEVSQVLYTEAQDQVGEAVREIMFEAVKAQIKARFGAQLEALGRLAADEYVDDVELNLSIEEHIGARRERQAMLDIKIKEALAGFVSQAADADTEEVAEEDVAASKPAGRGKNKKS